MRAKSEIFTVSPKTFRAKVQTSYDKEEKTSQHALYGPHLLIKEDIPGKCSCRKKTVNTEGHRIETENSIGRLGVISWKSASFDKVRDG